MAFWTPTSGGLIGRGCVFSAGVWIGLGAVSAVASASANVLGVRASRNCTRVRCARSSLPWVAGDTIFHIVERLA